MLKADREYVWDLTDAWHRTRALLELFPLQSSATGFPRSRWFAPLEDVQLLQDVAGQAVEAQGFCHLLGIELPSRLADYCRGSLPTRVVIAGAVDTMSLARRATKSAAVLSADKFRAEELVGQLTALWARLLVLRSETRHWPVSSPDFRTRITFIQAILTRCGKLEDELDRPPQLIAMSRLCKGRTLRELQQRLWSLELPWWADGTLENLHDLLSAQPDTDRVLLQVRRFFV